MANSAFSVNGTVGVWQLLSHQTIVSAASVVFNNIVGSYHKLYIMGVGVLPANIGDNFLMQLSNNNGVSYVTSANYIYANSQLSATSGTTSASNSIAGTSIQLAPNVNFIDFSYTFENINIAANSVLYGQAFVQTAVPDYLNVSGMGFLTGTSTINAIKLFFSTGNIMNGDFYLYAILP